MSLINCLKKSSFTIEEQTFLLNKSKELQGKGLSQKDADIQVVKDLQESVLTSLKDIYTQLEIPQRTKVREDAVIDSLKPMRIAYKSGPRVLEQEEYNLLSKKEKEGFKEIVKPAQVLLPWNIRNKAGRRVDIKKYINENGFIDTKKIPRDLLRQFGFRIPNQGHNSMALIEVVGFLPEVMGDVVIAPRNFITQMGSDFDIDKLYIYDYYTTRLKSGKIVREKDNIKNDLLDIHKAILFNPKVFDSVVNPLDFGKLKYKTESGTKGIAVELASLESKALRNYLNPDFGRNKYLQSIDGKSMVGIESLSSTFSSLIQGKNLFLQKQVKKGVYVPDYIVFGTDDGNVLKLTNLSNPFTLSGRTKNSLHAGYQSAAVDNEKDPILSYINSSPITAPVQTLLRDLGLEEEHVSLFLAQPVLKEYARRVKGSRGSLVTEKRKTDSEILQELIDEYSDKVSKEANQEINNLDIADLPLAPQHFRQVLFGNKATPAKFNEATFLLTNDQIQLVSLVKFEKIKVFGDIINRAQGLINIESGGIGKSLIEVADRTEAISGLSRNQLIGNISNVLGEYVPMLVPTTLSGYAIWNSLLQANNVFNKTDLMPYGAEPLLETFKQYEDVTGRESNADDKNEVWKALRAYVYGDNNREQLFFDKGTNNSLATKIEELRKTKLKDNAFIKRVSTEINKTGKKPSYVFYNSAKEENIEELNVYQAFTELYTNNDPEIAEIGVGLIQYFFANGGNQQAREWGRFINTEALRHAGLHAYLNTVNFNDPDTIGFRRLHYGITHGLIQYFQHKPYKLRELPKQYSKSISFKGASSIEEATELTLPSPYSKDAVRELLGDVGYSPLFSIRNSNSRSGYSIYYGVQTSGANIRYIRIPTLGTKFFNEYQHITSIATSLLDPKTAPIIINQPYEEKDLPKESNTPAITNPKVKTAIDALIDTDIATSLSHIGSSVYNKKLAEYFLKLGNILEGTQVKVENSDKEISGRYDRGDKNIYLNTLALGLSVPLYEKMILHETIHAIVDKTFRNEGFTSTTKQKAALKSLEDLYHNLRNQVLAGEFEGLGLTKADLEEFDRLFSKVLKKEALTEAEGKFLNANTHKYYGISAGTVDGKVKYATEEFITHVLTEPRFQEILNKIKYSSNKNLLDRFHQLIIDILNEFATLLGINKDSVLEEAFAQTLNLFALETDATQKAILGTVSKPNQQTLDFSRKNILPGANEYALSEKVIVEEANNKYGKLANDFKSRIVAIERNISKAYLDGDKALARRLEERKDEVTNELEELLDNVTTDTIVRLGNKDLEYVETILKQPYVSVVDIRYAQRILSTWKNVTKKEYGLLTKSDKGTLNYTRLRDIREKANTLEEDWLDVAKSSLLDSLKKESGIDTLTEDVINSQIAIDAITANTLDISRSGNIVLSVMAKQLKSASVATKAEGGKIKLLIDELVDDLKTTTEFQKNGYDTFAQVNNLGTRTGDLVSPLKYEYYEEREKLLANVENAPNEAFKAKAWRKYFEWVKENHTILDTRKLFKEDNEGKFVYTPEADYIQGLKQALGVDFERLLQEAKDNIEQYNEDLELQKNTFKDDPDGFRYIEKWKAQNNPNVYMNNLVNGYQKQIVEGKTIHNKGYKYVTRRALDKWEDPQYNIVQADEKLKKFYDFATSTLNDLYSYLPYSFREGLTKTSLPNVPKDLAETYSEKGMRAALSGLGNNFVEAISVPEQSEIISAIKDPSTGKLERSLKVQYLKPLDPEDKSYDIGRVLKLFALEALAFKHKSKVEDSIRLAESVLQDSLEKQLTPSGKPVKDRFGEITSIKGLKNFHDQLEYAIDAFYGERKVIQGVTKTSKIGVGKFSIKLLTDSDKKEIAKEIERINNSKDLSDEEKAEKIQEIENDPKRYFSFGKATDLFLKYVQLKGMGWNVFGGVTNVVYGWVANFNWAAGGRDFSLDNMLTANGIMLSTTLKSATGITNSSSRKVNALMVKFDVLKEIIEAAYKSTTDTNRVRKGIEKLSPFELQRRGEYFVQGQTMVSLMLATKIKDKHGVEHSVWDAFDENGFWKKEQFGENKAWSGDFNNREENKDFIKFKLKLDQIVKGIHGNYDPDSPVRIKKGVLGRALLQFRSWVAEGFAQRFEEEKYDLLLERTRKGRYRTGLELLQEGQLFKTLFKQMIYRNSDTAFEHLNYDPESLALVKENMKRNLVEIYQKLFITALYLMLTGLDDDDDENKWIKNFTINQLLRLSDDIEFYYSPNAFENITRSAIPAATVIIDANKFLDATWDAILGDTEYKTGKKAGQNKMLWRGAKLLPFGSSLVSLINKGESAESFRK